MPLFDQYKTLLFPTDESKANLVESVKSISSAPISNFDEAYATLFFKGSEEHCQRILAPFLRALAIQHLKTANTVLAQGFRTEYERAYQGLDTYEPGDAPTLAAFYDQQGRSGEFARDIEASALAEALGVTFMARKVGEDNEITEEAAVLYYRAPGAHAPIVYLFNRPNNHFFVREGDYLSTTPDGNCLYNGFAQILHQYVMWENLEEFVIYQAQLQELERLSTPLSPLPLAILMIRSKLRNLAGEPDGLELARLELALKMSGETGGDAPPPSSSENNSAVVLNKEAEITARTHGLLLINAILVRLDQKIVDLEVKALDICTIHRNAGPASKAGRALLSALYTNRDDFLALNLDKEGFQKKCYTAIDTAVVSELANHPGIIRLLNVLKHWIGRLFAVIRNGVAGDRGFFTAVERAPQTEAVKIALELRTAVDHMVLKVSPS